MRPRSPEAGNRGAHLGVVLAGIGVDVACVGNLAAGRRVDAVDLGAGQALEVRDAKLLGQRVDARVLEELVARVVDAGGRRVVLEDALAWEFPWEVLARVEELEEGSDGADILVGEVNLAGLFCLLSVPRPSHSLELSAIGGTHAAVVNEAPAHLCKVRAP